jgi:hypothetical protein
MAFCSDPDHMEDSFKVILSSSTPPDGIIPTRPFPSGILSSQFTAGDRNLILDGEKAKDTDAKSKNR